MKQEFPKKYDISIEKEIYSYREKEHAFLPASDHTSKKKSSKKTSATSGERFMMTLPPPNVTGVLHV